MLHCHCFIVSVDRMIDCDCSYNWFQKVWQGFNCEYQISKVNSENQWFYHYSIGIHGLNVEVIDIFVNLCLKNEEMFSVIAQFHKKWSSHNNKEFVENLF